ncbi:hypothetical protein FOS14_13680 [Skermania sp. ID1734]|uniref:hypothetical protein n=1 Tax=Skermania sp. ID1734 TaxID=2597516 RepID=UPI00117E85C8|nr:hypothetical protein [Skermania sp. ID1734]TSD98047.1 hypothetical protein FOS14_13680 [Skermania sp. ID1734]
MRSTIHGGKHRLGMEHGVHCIQIPEVAAALAAHRRNWVSALVNPARHSFAAIRKRASTAPAQRWVPAPVG